MSTDIPPGSGSTPGGPPETTGEHVTTSNRDPHEMSRRLQQWLSDRALPPGSDPVITAIASPQGNGMSSETLLFIARWSNGGAPEEHRLVARIEPPSTAYPVFTTYDLDMQFRVMRLVEEHTSVPVPETLWYEPDASVLGGPFFIMTRVDGRVPPDVMPYTFGDNWVFDGTEADRRAMQESAIRAVAGIHSITPDRHDLDFLQYQDPGTTSLERGLQHWRSYHDWVVKERPSPLLAECFSWLSDHLPSDSNADVLSWGDSRIGNMMFRGNEVVAVLDWEMATVAPPEVDLGWMCYLHLFFQDLATQLGVPGLADLFRPRDVAGYYARVSGVDLGDLTWHIAYAAVRHGVIMRRVTERSVFFGEAAPSDEIDDLIMHRSTLRGMLDGSYWPGIGLTGAV